MTDLPSPALPQASPRTPGAETGSGDTGRPPRREAVAEALLLLDSQGLVRSVGAGATLLHGHGPADLVGRHVSLIYPPEDVASGAAARALDEAAGLGTHRECAWRVRSDGARLWAETAITATRDAHARLTGYCVVIRDLSARWRYERWQRAVAEVTASVVEGRPGPHVLALAARRVRQSVGAEGVRVLAPDWGDTLTVCAVDGVGASAARGLLMPGESELANEVVRAGYPRIVSDTDHEPSKLRTALRGAGLESVMGVPLTVRGRVVGLLEVANRRGGRRFKPEDLRFVEPFTGPVGLAVEQARADEDLDRLDGRSAIGQDAVRQALNSVAAEAVTRTGGVCCEVYLLEPGVGLRRAGGHGGAGPLSCDPAERSVDRPAKAAMEAITTAAPVIRGGGEDENEGGSTDEGARRDDGGSTDEGRGEDDGGSKDDEAREEESGSKDEGTSKDNGRRKDDGASKDRAVERDPESVPEVARPRKPPPPPSGDVLVALPLLCRAEAVGALCCRFPRGWQPGAEDLGALQALTVRAAAAVEAQRLWGVAREQAAREERRRLARELHDSLGPTLYGIALNACTARELLGRESTGARGPIASVLRLADAGLDEVRSILCRLSPDSLQTEGLVAALTRYLGQLRVRHGLVAEARLSAEPDAAPEVKHALYRIAQEALHNVIKHAAARHVLLRLCATPETVTLVVTDDGAGFDTGSSFPGHLGLHSMRERAREAGGTLVVDSRPGRGTRIRATVPARPTPDGTGAA
ncbi:GAF domain-containing protein [Streptomyces sp. NPDC050287]|uniref:GAF domain-containing protein n=1 Tax=Streptomyces sp. NPDC050287 TaxID=3365608 RepID=UPI00378D7B63